MSESHQPVCPASFSRLASLKAGHWWFRSRNRLILWVLERVIQKPFKDFLEIGCGTGFVLEGISRAFPYARLSGVEYLRKASALPVNAYLRLLSGKWMS